MLSMLTNLIPGFTWVKFAVVALALVGTFSAGSYAGWRWEREAYLTQVASDKDAEIYAVQAMAKAQQAQDDVALAAAVKEAQAQTQIITKTITVTKEIPRYVTAHEDAITCLPVGLARILRAAADGSDPSALVLSPGQSDDACSDVTSTEVASWFSAYAGAARANAEQLNALEAWAIASHDAQENVK